MPKFLDQPSWYVDVSGTPRQVWGAPMVEEFVNSSVELGDILSKQVHGGFSLRNLRVNNDAMSDINIYAPKSGGLAGYYLLAKGGSVAPEFQPLYYRGEVGNTNLLTLFARKSYATFCFLYTSGTITVSPTTFSKAVFIIKTADVNEYIVCGWTSNSPYYNVIAGTGSTSFLIGGASTANCVLI